MSHRRTPNGYLRCDARITRTGVFEYRNADGSTRRELRLPDEVFRDDSLASFDSVPLTNEHPREELTPKNTRRYQAGIVQQPRRADEHLAAAVLITDQDAIDSVEQGKTQLSCGYHCDLEKKSGVTVGIEGVQDGLHYDAIQRNIVGNHVAIVSNGRAGGSASLHLDAEDAAQVLVAGPPFTTTAADDGPARGVKPMVKVRIDEVDYEMDETAAQAVSKLVARLDAGDETKDLLDKKLAEAIARADKADEDLEKEKKARADASSEETIRAAVKARVSLETTAAKVIADEKLKLDELTDEEIRKAVVVKMSPGAEDKLKECDAAYLAARYDAALEQWTAEQDNKPKPSHGVRAVAAQQPRCDAAAARKRMLEDNFKMGRDPIHATARGA